MVPSGKEKGKQPGRARIGVGGSRKISKGGWERVKKKEEDGGTEEQS